MEKINKKSEKAAIYVKIIGQQNKLASLVLVI